MTDVRSAGGRSVLRSDQLRRLLDVTSDLVKLVEKLVGEGGEIQRVEPVKAPPPRRTVRRRLRNPAAAPLEVAIHETFRRCGVPGTTILTHLLANPGRYIHQEELLRVCASKSQSGNLVRVYICHIRKGFRALGFEKAIMTRGASYAVSPAAADGLLDILKNKLN